ncbi:large conductance mechanosensitive channel protein MscL [Ruminococcus gauvreauii]|uniref:Large-conductance mechanosensitive channel n=1 Tax=Ruminococcus gauvreauii TaxID=438033 RepID=A0ABY5VNS7_9FIRM|nr:large conductance mechanosensitive channel protein MscL [Ruminococcus gauvreauii]UWP60993.1 large conductance mechanosensitive channel protein MscL [Ruminococcus gauvreauii]
MKKGKNFIQEFRTFISRGNVMDMAVGVIIGAAFQAIVSSLIDDIINPVLGFILGGIDFSGYSVTLGAGADAPLIRYGSFISAVINFLVMAFVIFCLVKVMNRIAARTSQKEEAPQAPTTKVCPFCKTEIAVDAVRCPHCTSVLEGELAEAAAVRE